MTQPDLTRRHPDPLYREWEVAYERVLPVLGVPVRFEAGSADAGAIVEEAFALGRHAQTGETLDRPAVRVRIVPHEGDEGPARPVPIAARVPDPERLILATPGSFGIADVARRDAVAYVTAALLEERAHFRYGVLEALTLFLVTQFDRRPMHAAAVVRGGRALLLAGPTAVGKSCLAYAALRAGLEVLSEDAVYVQLEPQLRVWGMPKHLHLPTDAPRYFPELAGTVAAVQVTGKLKIVVEAAPLGSAGAPYADHVGVCVLARGRTTHVERLSPTEVERILTAQLETGFDLFADTVGDCAHALAGAGGWRLTVGDPPDQLVPVLHSIFDELEARR